MNKLRVIWIILKSHNYIVITNYGYHAVTPRFGHARYWKEARDLFGRLKKKADGLNEQFE